jgi:DNA-binding MarR family transcriptional regulator
MALETHVAENVLYEELMRQLSAIGSVRRELGRIVPAGCSEGSATVLALLGRHGALRIGKVTELLGVDLSVTSRHVAQLATLGWVDRRPDPADRRSRILRLTPEGRARLAELSEHRSRELAARLADWSDDDIHRLVRLLGRLRAGFDSPWTEPHAAAAPLRAPVASVPPHHTTHHQTRTTP